VRRVPRAHPGALAGGRGPRRTLPPERPLGGEGVVTGTREVGGAEGRSAGAPGPRAPLLQVEDLVAQYPIPRGAIGVLTRRPKQVVHAVDGVSFTLAEGEMVALVGESG